jgi:hypothetical protein
LRFRLNRNQISGNISEDFGIYPHIYYMDLSDNELYGKLSWKWEQFHNLTTLKISRNKISGEIPAELGKASNLKALDLSSNHLVGQIPIEVGKLKLLELKLSNNRLLGDISSVIEVLPDVKKLDLAANNLSGPIPRQIGMHSQLLFLNLSKNSFKGIIPAEIGYLRFLQSLDLSWNSLMGDLPQELGNLQRLESLNISHNMLSGFIPTTFSSMRGMTTVDVSNNKLEGPIPDIKAFHEAPFQAIHNNTNLCGNATGLEVCETLLGSRTLHRKGKKVVILITLPLLGFLFFLFTLIGGFFILRQRIRSRRKMSMERGDLFSIWGHQGEINHEDIIEATEGFNPSHCIGAGGFAAVYKAALPTGLVVAVKKFHQSPDDEMIGLKAFTSEMHSLLGIRHRNIVKLYGFCSHRKHSFLVYEFLERGSLRTILDNEEQAMEMDWMKRINLVRGVANALSYLHHNCSPPIVHRDISSNNILLDSEYEAHVSDFGTARLLLPDSSNWTSLAGTAGYTAPG